MNKTTLSIILFFIGSLHAKNHEIQKFEKIQNNSLEELKSNERIFMLQPNANTLQFVYRSTENGCMHLGTCSFAPAKRNKHECKITCFQKEESVDKIAFENAENIEKMIFDEIFSAMAQAGYQKASIYFSRFFKDPKRIQLAKHGFHLDGHGQGITHEKWVKDLTSLGQS